MHEEVAKLIRPQANPLGGVRRYKFVTTLTKKFVPGLVVLIQSMLDNSEIDFGFIVVEYKGQAGWDDPIDQDDRLLIERMGVPITWIPVDEVGGEFPFDRDLADCTRMRANIDKPLVWNLPYDEEICYLDADILCLDSLKGIHDFPSLSVSAHSCCVGETDFNKDKRYRHIEAKIPIFNAGWFVFRPDKSIYAEMAEYAKTYTEQVAFGDQAVFNNFMRSRHPDEINYIDCHWHVCTWTISSKGHYFNFDDIKFLHYAGNKPWAESTERSSHETYFPLWYKYYSRALKTLGLSSLPCVNQDMQSEFMESLFQYRNNLGSDLNRLGLTGEMAEVGTYRCKFAEKILDHWEGKKLHLIDRKFEERIQNDRVEFYEQDSVKAASNFEDHSLDCVYIDGGHSYQQCSRDLIAYHGKVKPGGVLCGHDFYCSWTPDEMGQKPIHVQMWSRADLFKMPFGVMQAVIDFCKAWGYEYTVTADDETGSPSWFVRIPASQPASLPVVERTKRVVGIATFPERYKCLLETIGPLVDQVDLIRVCLNGFDEIPTELQAMPKVQCTIPDRNLFDGGKFLDFDEPDTFFFACDIDVIYLSNFIERIIQDMEGNPGAIVKSGRDAYFHTDLLNLDDELIRSGLMTDDEFEAAVNKQKVPMVGISKWEAV